MKPINVLVTGVGAPGGITIMKALRWSSLPIRIVAADLNCEAVGLYFCEGSYLLPWVSDPGYLEGLKRICRDERVDIAFIGAERELRFLAPHAPELERETGTVFAVSRAELMTACLDKWDMTVFMKAHGLRCPVTARADDENAVRALVERFGFPLFLKPRQGSGSKGTVLVRDERELEFFRGYVADAVVQEWLFQEAEEYTVGTYVDRDGAAVGSAVSRRDLAAGLTYRAYFDSFPEVAAYCEHAARVLKPRGACNFQLRLTEGGPCIFEINPRCSSSTVMRAVMGYNEPEMAIRDLVLHEKVVRPAVKRGTALRFWEEAYVDGLASERLPAVFGKVTLPAAAVHPGLMTRLGKG